MKFLPTHRRRIPVMTEEKEKVVGSVWEAEFMKFLHTHRRRIKTEETAKVVGSVWGAEFIQFLAALAVCNGRFEE